MWLGFLCHGAGTDLIFQGNTHGKGQGEACGWEMLTARERCSGREEGHGKAGIFLWQERYPGTCLRHGSCFRELPTAGCPQPGPCQLEFGMLPWLLSLPGSSSSELLGLALPGTEISCFAFAPQRGRAGVGGWGPWGRLRWGCFPALAPKSPRGIPVEQEIMDALGPFSPEQVMKVGLFPRELVLLKHSSRECLPQDSTTSHRTGRWIPGSGWPWLFPAVPQRNSWQTRVARCAQMCGGLATAPHSPCLCSSRKPEQLKLPSTSRSLGGPGEGLVMEEVIDWDGFFSHYLVGNSQI